MRTLLKAFDDAIEEYGYALVNHAEPLIEALKKELERMETSEYGHMQYSLKKEVLEFLSHVEPYRNAMISAEEAYDQECAATREEVAI